MTTHFYSTKVNQINNKKSFLSASELNATRQPPFNAYQTIYIPNKSKTFFFVSTKMSTRPLLHGNKMYPFVIWIFFGHWIVILSIFIAFNTLRQISSDIISTGQGKKTLWCVSKFNETCIWLHHHFFSITITKSPLQNVNHLEIHKRNKND